jgi:hypothetical protein
MNRRSRRVLVTLALLAALAGWWWLGRPQEMRLVDVRPLELPTLPDKYSYYFRPRTDYLLAYSSAPSLAVMRWDGTVRWGIMPPKPMMLKNSYVYAVKCNWSVSPNGRYCTVVIAQMRNQKVMMWDEGQLIGSTLLPLTIKPCGLSTELETVLAQPTILDNGQAFCWIETEPVGSIMLLENGKIKARGRLPAPSGIKPEDVSYQVSPDGRVLIASVMDGFTIYRIIIADNTLRCIPVYTSKEPPVQTAWGILVSNRPFVTSDGFLVTDSGAVYDMHGRISGSTGWRLDPIVKGIPVPRSAIIQAHYVNSDMLPNYITATQIFDPHTGVVWAPKKQLPHLFSQATPDGKYLLVDERPGKIAVLARDWLRMKYQCRNGSFTARIRYTLQYTSVPVVFAPACRSSKITAFFF